MRFNERYPSIKTLTEAFGADKAKTIRAIMEGPSYAKDPLASATSAVSVKEESRLGRISSVLGVETQGFRTNKWGGLRYCNMGDSYAVTVIRLIDERRFIVGAWGDFAERDSKS